MGWLQLLAGWLLLSSTFFAIFSADGCEAIFGSRADPGSVKVDITDAPVDEVDTVRLSISRLEFGEDTDDAEGRTRNVNRTVENLLDLQHGKTQRLLDDELRSGDYEWIRLYLDPDGSEVVADDGSVLALNTTTGTDGESTLRVDGSFTVEEDETLRLVIDVELRQALVSGVGGYLLRPVLRLMDRAHTGALEGTVASSLVDDNDCINDLSADEGKGRGNAVYLYEGEDREPVDINRDDDGLSPDPHPPHSVIPVRMDLDSGEYRYRSGFLPAGDYTLAFSCQAMADFPDEANSLEFSGVTNIRIEEGETLEHDIE